MVLASLSLRAPELVAETRLERARAYFAKAQELDAALKAMPPSQRKEKDYQELMEAYRRVYFTAPTYGNSTICLMAIGALAEEAAPRFDKPQYFQKAIDAYEFLLQEYPHSQFRFEALLSIARIYREELNQPAKALEQYERYLKLFPGSAQSKAVEEAVAALRKKTDLRPLELAIRTPAPAKAVSLPEQPAGDAGRTAGPPDSPVLAGPAAVSDIRYWQTRDYTRVVVEMARPVKYEVGRLSSPDRLYLDLFETRVLPASGKSLAVEDEILQGIRLAQFNSTTSRVVLDLASRTEFAISELTNPYRLVIDVRSAGPRKDSGVAALEAAAARNAPPALSPTAERKSKGPASSEHGTTAQPKSEQAQAPAKEPASKPKTAEKASRPAVIADAAPPAAAAPPPEKIKAAEPINGGTHSLTRALGLKIGRILIDPGHGGHDTGTIGPSGYTEKELVLDIAQRLGKLIEEQLGSEVIYTREDDRFVSLEDRAQMANQRQADLFISIHANSSRSKAAAGIETYYLSLTADPEALEVAARENAVSQETISELQGLVSKIALNEKVDESRAFAEKVQAALRKNLARGNARKLDRGVKKAPFVVLIGADMPAILAEVTFLSNPEEEKRLRTEKHRQQIAEALYEGVASYAGSLSGVKPAPARAEKPEPTQTASLD
ncbi:MAG TPA: N-acetylmuramoyl-L-alanine amidase [Terriglobia bacterium]|nr:N-acetylmuramoyl-L-alanine amidase [Terriglobia bacterium]